MHARSWRRWIAVIVLLALFVRLGAIFALNRWDSATPGVYRQLALGLLETGSFTFREHGHFGPSSVATPPYPVLLAALFKVFGPETPTAYFAALAVNALLGALTAVVVATLVRRVLSMDVPNNVPALPADRAAIAAGLALAVWPPQVFAATFAQPMVLSTLIVATTGLLWARSLVNHSLLTWIGFAIAATLAVLLEPMLASALVFFVVAIALTRRWPVDVRVRNLAVLALAGVLLLLPWAARNRAVHGSFLLTTKLWQRVWFGTNDNATGSDRLPFTPERRATARVSSGADDNGDTARPPLMQIDAMGPEPRAALRDRPEIEREAIFRQLSQTWIDAHRALWFRQLPVRLLKCWWIDYDHPMARTLLAMLPRTTAAAGALVALALLWSRRAALAGVLIVLLAALLAEGATSASAKTTILIEPSQLALCFAAVAIVSRREGLSTALQAKQDARESATRTIQ